MESDEAKRYIDFLKKNFAVIGFLGVGVIFLLVGFVLFMQEKNTPPEMTIVSNQATASGSLKVDVEGAVMKPGVYELETGSRVQDGLVAAGGLASGADREYVSKNVNLAAKVVDGAKIYIPKKGEPPFAPPVGGASEGQAVNINTASVAELDKLYGVGQATAEKIIAGRPYSKIEDLLEKKVLGQAIYEKIKEKVTVY